ncbi:D-alanyl-lipoteichoic acid biosynthesis protein DltD [Desulfosporosinus sp. Sb-LF]|uniref:D-alanyl-lipoteichoic acid biosynthesis protein DltD n=1 Tax=Desulfosporosinus sp. Sb-LF TaxID=2560027 RepID=UPI00107F164D|nr:D-alanyl-lipoteichoic acid biosynthesis protein DltD [Desulfosporosinus sp. Sb-LF]TGE32983.1 D-alanyl-lipoteichoic acid biosynthesis protein DltD [Desulfosporosinus sp. Sb-LF]
MMNAKRLGPMVIAFIIFWLTILYTGAITQDIADYFWLTPGVIEAAGLAPPQEVLLGSIFQHKAMKTGDVLPMYGSSELGTGYDFNPTRVFANRPTDFTPFIIGRGSCQTLVHILNIAAQNDIKEKKIVITFSPDWFGNLQGIPNDKFSDNSSPLKVYDVLFNPDLSPKLKNRIVKRILDLPQVAKDDYLLKEYLTTYKSSDWKSLMTRLFLWPQVRLEYASMQIQDARNVKIASSKLDRRIVTKLASPTSDQAVNWEKIKEQAVTLAKTKMKNDFNIEDDLYAKNVKPATKGYQKGANKLNDSVEYDDLKLMLELLKEKHVRPLFVMIPHNGLFRDYTGLSLDIRKTYYQKVFRIIQDAGFQCVDLSSHERELYFMQDPWHLGWKGWAELDQIINDFDHN